MDKDLHTMTVLIHQSLNNEERRQKEETVERKVRSNIYLEK